MATDKRSEQHANKTPTLMQTNTPLLQILGEVGGGAGVLGRAGLVLYFVCITQDPLKIHSRSIQDPLKIHSRSIQDPLKIHSRSIQDLANPSLSEFILAYPRLS